MFDVGYLKSIIKDLDDNTPIILDGQYSAHYDEVQDAYLMRVRWRDCADEGVERYDEGFMLADEGEEGAEDALYLSRI